MWKRCSLLSFALASAVFAQAPANDTCSGAIALPAPGVYPGTNAAATASTSGVGSCILFGSDVWFTYNATGTGHLLVASTCPPGSSSFSSSVDILTGSCAAPTSAACSTTYCDQSTGFTGARAVVSSTVAGTVYLIRVRGVLPGLTGTFNLYLDEVTVSPPANGTCASPLPIVDGVNTGLTNLGEPAGLAAGFTPGCGAADKDVFFAYLATGSGGTTIRTCSPVPTPLGALSLRDSVIAVYASCGGGTPIACNDNGCGGTAGMGASLSSVAFATTAGTVYIVQVASAGAGATAGAGNFSLEVIPPPTNDDCSGALALQLGTNPAPGASGVTYSMSQASLSAGWPNPPACTTTTISADLWFTFTPAVTGVYQIDTEIPAGFAAGTLADTMLEVYAGGCASGASLACDNDAGITGTGLLSLLVINLTAGLPYDIRVGDTATFTGGTFYVNVGFIGPAATNDDCNSPIILAPGPNGPFSNATATTSAGYSASCSTGYNDVFFAFTPTCASQTRFSTGCNGFDTVISIWNACGGSEIACNNNDSAGGCGASSAVTLNTLAGQTYVIRVASAVLGTTGTFNVDITQGAGLNWASPFGPGTLQFAVCGGPPNGTYYLFISFAAGAFPNGWFYGVDITLGEIATQIAFGYPFVGPLNGNGDSTSPTFGSVPSGLTLYSIAFGVPPGSNSASVNSGPKSYTTP